MMARDATAMPKRQRGTLLAVCFVHYQGDEDMSSEDAQCAGFSRRNLIGLGLAAGLAPRLALAQNYPTRAIRVIVGFVPGGATDTGARIVAAGLSEVLGAPVVVENKPGATGVLATEYVARSAAADGYTLLVGTATPIIVAPQAMRKQTFHPLTDLAPINMVVEQPQAFAVNPRLPVRRMKDLVALSRTRQVSVGVSGIGGSAHLLVEALIQATGGGNFLVVPYKGSGPALADVVAGHVDANVSDVGSFLPMYNEGRLAIAATATEKRLDILPNVPTCQEDLPGLVMSIWLGVFAPAKTPKPILAVLDAAMLKVVARDDVRTQFARTIATMSSQRDSEAFARFVAADYQRYGKLIRDRGIAIKE
jgi:tripartite-type tricarboxylate transporter receptor subunit TctC